MTWCTNFFYGFQVLTVWIDTLPIIAAARLNLSILNVLKSQRNLFHKIWQKQVSEYFILQRKSALINWLIQLQTLALAAKVTMAIFVGFIHFIAVPSARWQIFCSSKNVKLCLINDIYQLNKFQFVPFTRSVFLLIQYIYFPFLF